VRDGARVSAANFGAGKGGSLLVKASESVEVIGGISADLQSGALLDTENYGSGDGGDLRIDTGRLLVRVGQVTTGTFGAGKGGNLLVKASESAEVIGVFANGLLPSGLFTNSEAYTFINGNIDSEPILRNGSSNNQIPNGGDAGNLIIDTRRLIVRDGALVGSPTFTSGKGGTLQITASDSIELSGNSPIGQPSVLFSRSRGVDSSGNPLIANGGDAGNIIINTGRLILRDGAAVDTTTETLGQGGILQITASDSIELIGTSFDGLLPSGLFTDTRNLYPNNPDSPQVSNGGNAGNLTINTKRLIVRDGAQVSSGTATSGNGGTLRITASDLIELSGTSPDSRLPSGLSTRSGMILSNNSILLGTGTAGNLIIDTGNLLLRDGAELSTNSLGEGLAGDITITVRDTLQANNGTIRTDSAQSRGGSITITAGDIRLFGDSDIRSNVASGAGGGGNIYLKAGSIVALDDSDILAFARDGRGGNITLNTPAFFGQNYRPAPRNTNPDTLDHNDRVDVNASGAVSGIITTPDTSFIQNSLTELPSNQINTDSLLANSCIVRRNQPSKGTFFITGTGGLPQRPGDTQLSTFPMVDITTLPQDSTFSPTDRNRPWQKGDPIVEPQGMYRLPNGKLVLSRECSE
jgi:large exoprotein involved in heme utilization and adhesion